MTPFCIPLSTISTLPALRDYDCPAWCERTDHQADVVDAKNPSLHYGPTFGTHLDVSALGNGVPFGTLGNERDDEIRLSALAVREFASNALDAAAWLEGASA